ncbi:MULTISPECIES: hypothetical protein [unclassified Rhizobium]|uniref:hypothetical protein n=1 Tax=unclassified Rhizobium TaxID=2613769 RepID=UPI0007F06D9A|nr:MULTISPECIES: hypothetical protein [unclassified Rhizobium]ANM09622.1 hypothetical protein AMK05_CH01198 [Rhizobium sp. N324]OYD03191.1 hypothetical protein AMK08_CH101193 [Rhizobium sp. N4311]
MSNFKEAPALKKMPRLVVDPNVGQSGGLSIDDVIRAIGRGGILTDLYPDEMESGTGAAAASLDSNPEVVQQPSTSIDMLRSTGAQAGQKREHTPFEKVVTGEPQSPQAPSVAGDMAKSFGSGLVRGATELVMLPVTAKRLMEQGSEYVYNQGIDLGRSALGMPPVSDEWKAKVQQAKEAMNRFNFDNAIYSGQDAVRGVMDDNLYAPKTTPGKYAQTAGEFVPGVLVGGGGNLLTNAVKYGVVPGVASEAAGQATEGTKLEPYARLVGALLGGGIIPAGERLITPLPVSAERQMLNQTLKDEGIDVSGGQASGSVTLRNAEGDLGGGAAQEFNGRQGDQFTRAALARAGINADRATRDVMVEAGTRIGDGLDMLAANHSLIPDQQLVDDITTAMGSYNSVTGEGARAPLLKNSVVDIARLANGETYKAVRSRLEDAQARSWNDPKLLEALSGIRNAMDDAMERSIAAQNPNSLSGWQEAKRQYRNFLDLEKAVAAAGGDASKGIISPSQLQSATRPQSPRALAQEDGDFTALVKAGEEVLKPLSSSGGSPVRSVIQKGIPALVSAVAGHKLAGGHGAMLGAIAGGAVPYAAGRILLSSPVRAYLQNQLIQPTRLTNPRVAALAQALLSQQAAQGQQQPTR